MSMQSLAPGSDIAPPTQGGGSVRRRRVLAALGAGALPWPTTRAQARPSLVKVLCGYPAGGGVDLVTRKLADKLAGRLAVTAVVDNRPGAAGRLAIEEIRRAPPDTAVVVVTPASVLTLYPHVYRQLSYDPVNDLAPLTTVAASGFALAVGPRVPAAVSSYEDFLLWGRFKPDGATMANAGAGSMPHLMAAMLAQAHRLNLQHVPYRSGQLAVQAAAAGEVDAALGTESAARALSQGGRVRVLATSWPDRSPFYPQAASMGVHPLAQREWFGAFVPARMPASWVSWLSDATMEVMRETDVRESWERLGLAVDVSGPARLRSALRQEIDYWGPVVKASGFTPEA